MVFTDEGVAWRVPSVPLSARLRAQRALLPTQTRYSDDATTINRKSLSLYMKIQKVLSATFILPLKSATQKLSCTGRDFPNVLSSTEAEGLSEAV